MDLDVNSLLDSEAMKELSGEEIDKVIEGLNEKKVAEGSKDGNTDKPIKASPPTAPALDTEKLGNTISSGIVQGLQKMEAEKKAEEFKNFYTENLEHVKNHFKGMEADKAKEFVKNFKANKVELLELKKIVATQVKAASTQGKEPVQIAPQGMDAQVQATNIFADRINPYDGIEFEELERKFLKILFNPLSPVWRPKHPQYEEYKAEANKILVSLSARDSKDNHERGKGYMPFTPFIGGGVYKGRETHIH